MKINEKGFGIIEIMLLIVVIAIIGVIGFYYFNASRPADKPHAATTTSRGLYTNNTKLYTVTLPKGWTTSNATADNSGSYLADYELADGKYANLVPPGAPMSPAATNLSKNLDDTPNAVNIFAFKTNDTKGVVTKYGQYDDKNAVLDELKLNGYSAIRSQGLSLGKSGTQTYTVDNYAVTHNDITLLITFLEKQGSSDVSETKAFDASANVPQFEDIAKSVRFLN